MSPTKIPNRRGRQADSTQAPAHRVRSAASRAARPNRRSARSHPIPWRLPGLMSRWCHRCSACRPHKGCGRCSRPGRRLRRVRRWHSATVTGRRAAGHKGSGPAAWRPGRGRGRLAAGVPGVAVDRLAEHAAAGAAEQLAVRRGPEGMQVLAERAGQDRRDGDDADGAAGAVLEVARLERRADAGPGAPNARAGAVMVSPSQTTLSVRLVPGVRSLNLQSSRVRPAGMGRTRRSLNPGLRV